MQLKKGRRQSSGWESFLPGMPVLCHGKLLCNAVCRENTSGPTAQCNQVEQFPLVLLCTVGGRDRVTSLGLPIKEEEVLLHKCILSAPAEEISEFTTNMLPVKK